MKYPRTMFYPEEMHAEVRIGRRCTILASRHSPIYRRIEAWAGEKLYRPIFGRRFSGLPFPSLWPQFSGSQRRWLR